MMNRQAAGGTGRLVPRFGAGLPLVYCRAKRSKVEGPIACGLIYCLWKGNTVSLSRL